MKVYHSVSRLPRFAEAYVTIGNFDGLHLGHQLILDRLRGNAGSKPTVAVTFESAPIETLNPSAFRGYIFPYGYKKRFLEKLGIRHIVNLRFEDVRDISAENFLSLLLKKIEKMYLYVGYNFRFGKGNTGDAKVLERESVKKGFALTVFERIVCDRTVVSSSLIRDKIAAGDMEKAGTFLGRPFFLASRSEKGDGIGKTIGFPTINLRPNGQVLPKAGVYFTLYRHKNRFYPSMTYIGTRPTISGNTGNVRIETHILDERADMAAIGRLKEHQVFFVRMTRGEKKLHNLDELRKTLYNDRKVILELAKRYPVPKTLKKILTEE